LGKSLDAVILTPPHNARCYAYHPGRVDLSGERSSRKRGAEKMTENAGHGEEDMAAFYHAAGIGRS